MLESAQGADPAAEYAAEDGGQRKNQQSDPGPAGDGPVTEGSGDGGQRVERGDVLADGPCTQDGELALGRAGRPLAGVGSPCTGGG